MTTFIENKEFSELIATQEHVDSLNKWTGAKVLFSHPIQTKIIEKDIRIVMDYKSFAAFFPAELWHTFDIQVNNFLFLPESKSDCWIAKKDYVWTKINIDPKKIDKEDKKYISTDLTARFNTACDFFRNNFINNTQAYPDDERNTMGYRFKYPNSLPSNRIRLGGDFHIRL